MQRTMNRETKTTSDWAWLLFCLQEGAFNAVQGFNCSLISNSPGLYWEVREIQSGHPLLRHFEARESEPRWFCPIKIRIACDFYDGFTIKSSFVREIILTCNRTTTSSINSRLSLESPRMKIVKSFFVQSELKIKNKN